MNNTFRTLLIFSVAILMGTAIFPHAQAQEEFYQIDHTDIFGKLRRPAIEFAHQSHAEALEEEGCGVCHHAPDEETGQLVYVEDEEVSCGECHDSKAEESTPALREAFHGSCNICHRQMGKSKKNFKGPTTCGECHVRK